MRVQGAEAPEEICQALDLVNALEAADLIITGRGGGSMEEICAFNEEEVARAISRSRIPVISAVGHEPDVTIADFVADQRASTHPMQQSWRYRTKMICGKRWIICRPAWTSLWTVCFRAVRIGLSVCRPAHFSSRPYGRFRNNACS